MTSIGDRHGNLDVQSDCEAGVDDADYESDSEGTSALALRRRKGSDDDEQYHELPQGRPLDGAFSCDDDDDDVDADSQNLFSDADSEGVGAQPIENEESEEEDNGGNRGGLSRRQQRTSDEEEDEDLEGDEVEDYVIDNSVKYIGHTPHPKPKDLPAEDGGEKKDVEPFVVPTAGAFYMHDDRFRESGGTRPRRSIGGRRLWEAKDEKRWAHDMFEDLGICEEEEGFQKGRGRNRGRGRGRGRVQGQGRDRGRIGKMNAFDDNRSILPRRLSGRGRGFIRGVIKGQKDEEPAKIDISGAQGSIANEVIQEDYSPSTSHSERADPKKLISNSVLNSSSPPFFPSGSYQPSIGKASVPDISGSTNVNLDVVKGTEIACVQKVTANGPGLVPKSNLQTGRVSSSSDMNAVSLQKSHSGSPYQSTDLKLHFSAPPTPSKQSVNSGHQAKYESFQGRAKVVNLPSVSQPLVSVVIPAVGRGQSSTQINSTGRSQEQALLQPSCENQGQASGNTPLGTSSVSLSGYVATQQSSSSRSNSAGGRGGRGMPSSRTTYVYNGVGPGAMSNGVMIGDQSYAPPQAITPVTVQYSGQSQGGLRVPAVGVALPNFGGQPQYGFRNSEITWVPVLAGGGALGFGSPYVAMEGTPPTMFYTQPPIQSSTFKKPGGDVNSLKTIMGPWKPPLVSEPGSEDLEQRQNKPRRYSEMNFGH